jgi:hypothetical protein
MSVGMHRECVESIPNIYLYLYLTNLTNKTAIGLVRTSVIAVIAKRIAKGPGAKGALKAQTRQPRTQKTAQRFKILKQPSQKRMGIKQLDIEF